MILTKIQDQSVTNDIPLDVR